VHGRVKQASCLNPRIFDLGQNLLSLAEVTMAHRGGNAMSTIGFICLSGIIAAFVVFAVVLAWGDYQTRSLGRQNRADQQRAAAGAKIQALQNAGKSSKEVAHS
jgi:hypothetical protein